jgi:hypothetical protein
MLHLFDAHASLFRSWRVVSYEQEGETYALQGPEQQTPGPSTITNLEDLLQFLEEALDAADKSVGSGHTA